MKTKKLALIEGITAGVLFGTAAVFIRFLQGLDTFYIAFWRVLIACLTLGIILVFLRRSFDFVMVRRNLKQLLILSFFLALHFIFFVSAVNETTILNATVLVNTTPIFSVLISRFIFRLSPSRLAILGLTISFAGVLLIAYAETTAAGVYSSTEGSHPSLKGDLEAVLAAVVEAFYLNYGRKVRRRMNILSTMFPMYLMTAAVIGVLGASATNKILSLPTRGAIILPLVGLGVLPTAIAHTLYFSSLSNLKSFETATMALLEPVGATILGVILFQERPALLFVFGAAVTMIGIIFVLLESTRISTGRTLKAKHITQ